ncbi:hypothetical protein GCM10010976_11320 [Bizionia arctica]|uniref:Uncharacterized protein n=1 Tax=Bizionia arctica TaxID=1495645 RepID=A0A917LLP6_9FLAO|nr:hypothetical protein GCM10010976_11320 [Bizionia arctica]
MEIALIIVKVEIPIKTILIIFLLFSDVSCGLSSSIFKDTYNFPIENECGKINSNGDSNVRFLNI